MDLITDGGYQSEATEQASRDVGVTQHLSGIKGRPSDPDAVSLAEAEFDGHEMVACPEGYTPYVQEFTEDTHRYWGRMDKSICGNCPRKDDCFVNEQQKFYSYGFYHRQLEVARHRAKTADPAKQELLNLRAGAESMINEVFHKTGKRTKFTGTTKVKNASIATAIGTNLKRVARCLNAEASGDPSPA